MRTQRGRQGSRGKGIEGLNCIASLIAASLIPVFAHLRVQCIEPVLPRRIVPRLI
jgi:hypothetical protein